MGAWRPKHVEWLCRNKTCTVLHQVGVSFDSVSVITHSLTYLLTYLITYLITPYFRVLLKKPAGSQLVKIFPHFMEPKCSLPHSQQPNTSPYPVPAQSIPCLSYIAGFPKWSLSSSLSPPTPCMHVSSTSTRATCPAHLIRLDLFTRTICDEQYRSLSSSLCSFLHSPVTSCLLGPKYFSAPCSRPPSACVFLSQCEWPSFTPVQNNRQKYISTMHHNIEMFA